MTNNRSELRKLMITVLFSAASFILMVFPQIPIIPQASFLELELSIIPLLLLSYFVGLKYGLFGLILRSLLHLILLNKGVATWIGLTTNIAAVLAFMLVFVCLRKQNIWLAAITATAALTIVAVIVNVVFAIPLYARFMNFDINKILGFWQYILLMVVPFNIIQGLVWSAIYYPIEHFFTKIFKNRL
ncbi:MAG: ECF transporter S component [Oenococcus sp.]|uniref:ECF transporter S component n=1 Tax=Oenococcus sp. TaxID=1979414 RepID=UPI0039EB155C